MSKKTTGEIVKFEDTTVYKSLKAAEARHEKFTEAWKKQREWALRRSTTQQWLDENKREWDALDRMCRTRPWAINRDKSFPYPFHKATDEMRKIEGPWLGDEYHVANTRVETFSEVITQLVVPDLYPPDWRVIIFAQEFASQDALDLDNWSFLEPEGKVDIWLVSWQGWNDFDEMVEQVNEHCLSFGDGTSTIWFAQGMGGIVAYEVAKRMEKYESPNFPYGLVVSDCPAPDLFPSIYKPHEMDIWEDLINSHRITNKQKRTIVDDLRMLKTYKMNHAKNKKKLHMAVKAFYHDGDRLGVDKEACEQWAEYTDDFELMEPLDEVEEFESYETGKGYAYIIDPAIVATLSEMGQAHPRYDPNPVRPDLGDMDGPIPEEIDILVVGCGVTGLQQGMEFRESTDKSILMVDRIDAIGGVWHMWGNDYSRVNTSEIGYRFIERGGTWVRANEDHTPKHDMMRDMYSMAAFNKDNFRMNLDITRVTQREDEKFEVTMKHTKRGTEHKLIAGWVSLHVNRRLGKARDIDWEDTKKFKGHICYGYRNEVRGVDFWNKDVMIVGAGAFAFENIRSSIEHGAKFTTMLGRRAGCACPKWVDMIAFLRPMDKYCNTHKAGAAISFEAWRGVYVDANLPTPAAWDEGLLKPLGHTISVSDLAFIGGFHGLFGTKVGEIARVTPDGKAVQLKNGDKHYLDLVIKCTGFHLNDEVASITGLDKMYPSQLMKFNMSYPAEPLFDAGQFGSAKGNTQQDIDWGFTHDEFTAGLNNFNKTGFSEMLFAPLANPYGSGYGGPSRFQTKYFAWLATHPEEAKAMLECGGKPEMNVKNFWQSQMGPLQAATSMRTVVRLKDVNL